MEAVTYPRPACTAQLGAAELAARTGEAEALAERFQALADANRLKALHLLHTRGEMCVCELQEVLGITASNLSFHLGVLRHAGFVISRKDGKRVFYRLAPSQPHSVAQTIEQLFSPECAGATPSSDAPGVRVVGGLELAAAAKG